MITGHSRTARQTDMPVMVPIGGIDTTTWDHALDSAHASLINNMFIDHRNMHTRPGYENVGTVEGSIAATLMPFEFSGQSILLSNSNGKIRNALTGDLLYTHNGGGAKMSWDHISNHLVMACTTGAWYFDGTTVTPSNWNNAPATFGGVVAHNERLFYWEQDSLDFYYAPVGAITGDLTLFPLSRLGSLRGKIVNMSSWTVDAGHGVNDVLVIVTSQGDVIVYEGIDPGDALDWRMSGIYNIGSIIRSKKPTCKVGADLLIQTYGGIVSMTRAIRGAELALSDTFTEKVDEEYLSDFFDNFGIWQTVLDPKGKFVLVNSEALSGEIHQYVKCLSNGAWVRWSGIEAADWCALGSELYFITKVGGVYRFGVGDTDDGADIVGHIEMGGADQKRSLSVSLAGGTFSCDGEFTLEVSVTGQEGMTGHSSLDSPPDGEKFRKVVMPVTSRGDTVQMVYRIFGKGQRVTFRSAEARGTTARRRL